MKSAWVAIVMAMGGCGSSNASAPGVKAPVDVSPVAAVPVAACLADSIGALSNARPTAACATSPATCADDCKRGDAIACWTRAHATEPGQVSAAETSALDRRGCELGVANSCTNLAAEIWTEVEMTSDAYECARRMFTAACTAGDHFACGMEGRLRIDRAFADAAQGRAQLEESCEAIGGFACRILALELERNALGIYPPDQLQTLLARACATGDGDACGTHATVSETFH